MSSVETITIASDIKYGIEDIFDGILFEYKLPSARKTVINNQVHKEIIKSIYNLTEEARIKSADVFKNIETVISATTEDGRRQSFFDVINGLFDDTITWGKVVVALGFMVEVLMRVSKSGSQYEKYRDMSEQVFIRQIHPWVKVNGGWTNFVNLSTARDNEQAASVIATVGKAAFIFAGLWAINKYCSS